MNTARVCWCRARHVWPPTCGRFTAAVASLLLAGMIPQAKILLLAAEGLVAVVCIFVLFLKQTGDNR